MSLGVMAMIYFVLGLIGSIVVGVGVAEAATVRYPSCILFTRKDEIQKEELLSGYRSNWRITALGFTASVASGMVSTYLTWLWWRNS